MEPFAVPFLIQGLWRHCSYSLPPLPTRAAPLCGPLGPALPPVAKGENGGGGAKAALRGRQSAPWHTLERAASGERLTPESHGHGERVAAKARETE